MNAHSRADLDLLGRIALFASCRGLRDLRDFGIARLGARLARGKARLQ